MMIQWWKPGFVFILWPNRANALQAVSCIDRCGRLGQWLDTPGLSFYIYKVGKMIPAVATSHVITDIKAGLMTIMK